MSQEARPAQENCEPDHCEPDYYEPDYYDQGNISGGFSQVFLFLAVFLPFALAYFYSYLVRNLNATLSATLTDAFALTKAQLGTMTAAYFFSFTLAQVPMGLAMDRFGPRRIQSLLYAVAALGCACFALADGFIMLTLGRFLIGIGVAGGLMCGLKALSLWFARERLYFLNNLMLAFGGLGAMAATVPVQWLDAHIPWPMIFWGLCALALLVPASLMFLTPEKPQLPRKGHVLNGLWAIARQPAFIYLVPGMCFGMASGMAIQSLWMGPWIDDMLSVSPAAKGWILLTINGFFVVTALGLGWFTALLARLGLRTEAVMVGGLVLGGVSLVALTLLPPKFAVGLFALTITMQNACFLIYAYMTHRLGPELAGRSNALINTTLFAIVWAILSLLGVVIDAVTTAGGSLAQGYSCGFWGLAAGCLLSLLWALLGLRRGLD